MRSEVDRDVPGFERARAGALEPEGTGQRSKALEHDGSKEETV
ncbi:MAG TPA: hypothetical protein VFH83_15670 [Spirochaetia bacterium]|nr:hypothetical protein [Spirochaetia bacterium]